MVEIMMHSSCCASQAISILDFLNFMNDIYF